MGPTVQIFWYHKHFRRLWLEMLMWRAGLVLAVLAGALGQVQRALITPDRKICARSWHAGCGMCRGPCLPVCGGSARS